jgi:hypothetical protein
LFDVDACIIDGVRLHGKRFTAIMSMEKTCYKMATETGGFFFYYRRCFECVAARRVDGNVAMKQKYNFRIS